APNGEAGVYFPRRLASVSKQDGIIWGARVNDNDPSKPEIRVGGQTYISSTVSGYITQTGPNPQASAAQPIYRIRRDYKDLSENSLEVILEAAEFYQIEPSEVTQKQARSIINRYAYDWQNWPGHLGAPYYDLNGNGSYDKGIDEPGLAEADQVIWMVTNDLDVNKSVSFAGSPPIGLEIQTTMWGYAGDSGTLADIAFQRYRFINHSGYQLDTMFVARWADPDIGDGENDFAGCDSILELGYVYNGTSFETPYEKVNLAPATYGYSLLQGPIRESPGDTAIYNFQKKAGFRNNTLSSFGYFASGSPARMPIQGDYEATELFFYWLNGYLPLWFGYFNPYIHGAGPFRGNPTFYPLNGEPIDQSFDVDGLEDNLSAGDRIILLTSGKFEMAPGDTQEVIYAALGGLGDTWLQSVADLKDKQHLAAAMQQDRFRNIPSRANFNWRTRYLSSSESEVVFNARIENAIDVTLRLKTPEGNPVTDLLMFDDGMHEDGAAGDGIWGVIWQTPQRQDGLNADLDVTYSSGFQITRERIARNITTAGPLEITDVVIGSDNLNEDGQVNPGENVRFTLKLRNNGGVSINDLNIYPIESIGPNLTPNFRSENGFQNFSIPVQSEFSWPYQENDPYFFMQIPPVIAANDSLHLVFKLESFSGAAWKDTVAVFISPLQEQPEDFLMTKLAGTSDGNLGYRVFDSAQITGNRYSVTFDDTTTLGDPIYTLRNETVGTVLQQGMIYPDEFPHNSIPQDGFLITRGSTIPEDDPSRWEWVGGPRWLSGVNWGGRSFNGGVELGPGFFGSTLSSDEINDVAIVFDTTQVSISCVFWRSSGYIYAGLGIFPGAAYDIDDPANPRRVNIAFVEDANDGLADLKWNPRDFANGGREYLFIMKSDYDASNGGFYVEDGMLFGNTDTQWAMWPGVRGGFTALQNPGTLRLYLKNGIRVGNHYEFTPALTSVVDDNSVLTFELAQNYPNPFNPETIIKFQLPVAQKTTLQIFNVLGQKVAKLVDDNLSAGSYSLRWQGTNDVGSKVSSGVYFYRIESGDFVKTRKMLLIR
ncbi:MAG: T9SS type A sorting domain-containing protein, partial [Calditrichota bacterium]